MQTGIVPHKSNTLGYRGVNLSEVGGFALQTSISDRNVVEDNELRFTGFLSAEDVVQDELDFSITNSKAVINGIGSHISSYVKFSSFSDTVYNAVLKIREIFPAALYSTSRFNIPNINSINYDRYEKTTTISIQSSSISNPFNIIYYQTETVADNRLRDLVVSYLDYDFIIEGQYFDIINVTPSYDKNSGNLIVEVDGKYTENRSNYEILIRPKESVLKKMIAEESPLVRYIVESDYRFFFITTEAGDNGVEYTYRRFFEFPRLIGDNYNLDYITNRFTTFEQDLLEFAVKQDKNKYNVLRNYILPESLVEFQSVNFGDISYDEAAYDLMNVYYDVVSYHLDEIHTFINALKYNNSINHSKQNIASNIFLKSLIKNFGWDEDVINNGEKLYHLAVESPHVFKSKGTLWIIEQIMDYYGIPKELYELSSYRYDLTNKVSYDKIVEYLLYINKNYDKSQIPVNKHGYPLILESFNGDLSALENLIPDVNITEIRTEDVITQIKTLANKQYQTIDNSNVNVRLLNSSFETGSCYSGSVATIDDPYPEDILDVCGCPLPLRDNSLSINTIPRDLKSCNGFFADIWYECVDRDTSEVYYTIWGGKPPYNTSGIVDGQAINNDQLYTLEITDANGCHLSYDVSGTCVDPCINSNLELSLSYACQLDEFGNKLGTAKITVAATGGSSPYTFVGVQNGDIVNDGEIVTVYVEDSNGCRTKAKGLTIDCEATVLPECQSIDLISSLEVKDIDLEAKIAVVDFAYILNNIPSGLNVDSIELSTTGVGADDAYLVGSPATRTFSSPSGADSVTLSFSPDAYPTSVTLSHDLTINLTNSCQYTYTVTFTVNPQNLGDADNDSTTLNP